MEARYFGVSSPYLEKQIRELITRINEVTKNTADTTSVISSYHSQYVSQRYEIPLGCSLEIQSNAFLEVG